MRADERGPRLRRAWTLAYAGALLVLALGMGWNLIAGQGWRVLDCPITDLQLQADRALWFTTYKQCWSHEAGQDLISPPLAGHLTADSFGIAPGYGLALVLLTIAVTWPCHRWLRHWACVPAVAAALFDGLENGLLFQAGAGAKAHRLPAALIEHLSMVATIKWSLLATSCLVLALFVSLQSLGVWHRLRPRALWGPARIAGGFTLGWLSSALLLLAMASALTGALLGLQLRLVLAIGPLALGAALLVLPLWLRGRRVEREAEPS